MSVFATLVFALAIGFVISGIVSNLFGLMTNGQSLLHLPPTTDARRLVYVGVLIFAGPHVLFRAAHRSMQIGNWPPAYTFTAFGICSLWSLVVGFAVLKLFIV